VPATAGSMLNYTADDAKYLSPEKQREFRSGVGKLLHLAKWSRPEIKNAVRELTRGMTQATEEAYKSMQRVMKHCVETPNRGLLLAPTGSWSGDPSAKTSTCWPQPQTMTVPTTTRRKRRRRIRKKSETSK
jgi:hypothetical protein